MRLFTTTALAASLLLLASGKIGAQVKELQGEQITATATIQSIEKSTRTLTVKDEKGFYETLQVPTSVARFDAMKVGDRITVRYYDNVVVRLKKPGEPAVDVEHAALTPSTGQKPGGTAATQQTLTVTITAIDNKAKIPTITVKGPNGYVYSRQVEDKKALAQVKVGDRLDLTWTEALVISIEPAK